MSTRDPETILAAWLDEGPRDLPDATRRAILTAIPTTQQARRGLLAPWRFLPMNSTARLAIAALVAVIAVGGALYLFAPRSGVGGGPSPTPSPATTTPAPTTVDTTSWTTFGSPRFGVSFKVPPGWTTTAASAPWIWQPHDPGPAVADTVRASDNAGFTVASEKIPAGMTDDAWWADYLSVDTSTLPAGCFPKTKSGYRVTTVDGHPAYVHGEVAACNFSEAIVLVGGRAYELDAQPNLDTVVGKVFDPALFDAWLATVKFDPARADDTPVPTASPITSPTPS